MASMLSNYMEDQFGISDTESTFSVLSVKNPPTENSQIVSNGFFGTLIKVAYVLPSQPLPPQAVHYQRVHAPSQQPAEKEVNPRSAMLIRDSHDQGGLARKISIGAFQPIKFTSPEDCPKAGYLLKSIREVPSSDWPSRSAARFDSGKYIPINTGPKIKTEISQKNIQRPTFVQLASGQIENFYPNRNVNRPAITFSDNQRQEGSHITGKSYKQKPAGLNYDTWREVIEQRQSLRRSDLRNQGVQHSRSNSKGTQTQKRSYLQVVSLSRSKIQSKKSIHKE